MYAIRSYYGIEKTVSEHGDGPVDAAYKAISKATGENPKLLDYSVGSITGGTDALGAVNVRIVITSYSIHYTKLYENAPATRSPHAPSGTKIAARR